MRNRFPTAAERDVLGAFRHTSSEVVLHTDAALLPRAPAARASSNYLLRDCAATAVSVHVSYHLNRLQGLDEATDYLVTLNALDRVGPQRVLRRMTYRHPVYDERSVAAQRRLAELSTPVIAYAGAYHGWGSTKTAAGPASRRRGSSGGLVTAAPYPCQITHVRTRPIRRAFRYRSYRSYRWLVDLDDLPRVPPALRPLAGFRSRDHRARGHPAPQRHLAHPSGGPAERLAGHDFLLWAAMASRRTDRRRVLVPGDTLLLNTDGLVDRPGHDMDAAIRQAGEILSAAPPWQPLPDLLSQIIDSVAVTRHDDIVVMTLRVEQPSES